MIIESQALTLAPQVCESPKPHTVDVLSALALALMMGDVDRAAWRIRAFDVKGAYRQCAIHPSSCDFAYVAVPHPQSCELMVFRMLALPFGSIKSVHSFLRVAHSLWARGVSELSIPWTNYFDDYVAFASLREQQSVTGAVHGLFKIIGWKFAESGAKAPPFAPRVAALGVDFDVTDMHSGVVRVDNTLSRKNDLVDTLENIIQSDHLPQHQALRLRGRMQFSAGQIFARLARKALAIVTRHAYERSVDRLDGPTLDALKLYQAFLSMNAPRLLRRALPAQWFILQMHPNGDSPASGLGGVLVDAKGNCLRFFSEQASTGLLEAMNVSHKKTIIFELEFLAIWCALHVWAQHIESSPLVVFTDNDVVRDSLIGCRTSSDNASVILEACLRQEFFFGFESVGCKGADRF